jgi:hypothetical protein
MRRGGQLNGRLVRVSPKRRGWSGVRTCACVNHTGLPYLAMTDVELPNARLRARVHMQKYNNYPWPEPPADYFGPDERMEHLAKVFGLTLADIKEKPLEIEPPFYVDYVRGHISLVCRALTVCRAPTSLSKVAFTLISISSFSMLHLSRSESESYVDRVLVCTPRRTRVSAFQHTTHPV